MLMLTVYDTKVIIRDVFSHPGDHVSNPECISVKAWVIFPLLTWHSVWGCLGLHSSQWAPCLCLLSPGGQISCDLHWTRIRVLRSPLRKQVFKPLGGSKFANLKIRGYLYNFQWLCDKISLLLFPSVLYEVDLKNPSKCSTNDWMSLFQCQSPGYIFHQRVCRTWSCRFDYKQRRKLCDRSET